MDEILDQDLIERSNLHDELQRIGFQCLEIRTSNIYHSSGSFPVREMKFVLAGAEEMLWLMQTEERLDGNHRVNQTEITGSVQPKEENRRRSLPVDGQFVLVSSSGSTSFEFDSSLLNILPEADRERLHQLAEVLREVYFRISIYENELQFHVLFEGDLCFYVVSLFKLIDLIRNHHFSS